MSIIDKLRKGRESLVEISGHKLTIRRPTDLEASSMTYTSALDAIKGICRFVVGWDLTEQELIPGGSPTKVPFDSELFAEWIEDQPDIWNDLIKSVSDAYETHCDKREKDSKN